MSGGMGAIQAVPVLPTRPQMEAVKIMKKLIRFMGPRFIALMSLALICRVGTARADNSYLLWFFDDPAITSLSGTSIHLEDLNLGGKTANAIRVKQVTGGTETYLDLGIGTQSIGTTWGIDGEYRAGPGYATIGTYDAATTFMIEIGNLTGTDWVALAHSEILTYAQLDAGKFISHSELDIPEYGPWTGGSYAVPEPSGALLLLLGGALMALRRRRHEDFIAQRK